MAKRKAETLSVFDFFKRFPDEQSADRVKSLVEGAKHKRLTYKELIA